MKKYFNFDLFSILSLSAILLLSYSCASTNYANSADNNVAIARLYIGLGSKGSNMDYELEQVEKIISSHFNGATIQKSKGIYQSKSENSLIVTIINCCGWEIQKGAFRKKIQKLAIELKQKFSQESILIEHITAGKNEAFEI